MPTVTRSNKGGALRGKARAAQVKTLNTARRTAASSVRVKAQSTTAPVQADGGFRTFPKAAFNGPPPDFVPKTGRR